MLRHVVLVKFKEGIDKSESGSRLKERLLDLEPKIPELIKMDAGINLSESLNACDFALVADFENENDLNSYRSHPDHIQVLNFLRKITSEIKVVDYFNN